MRADADARAAAMEARLANLGVEVEAMRKSARDEAAQEGERIRQETQRELAKIQTNADHEIASALKTAQLELKSYSAQLAIELARAKVRERMTPDDQDALVRNFVTIWRAKIPKARPRRYRLMPAAVASRYARALVDVVLAPNSSTSIRIACARICALSSDALAGSDGAGQRAGARIAVGHARPQARRDRIASRKSLEIIGVSRNFLLVLIDHRRLAELSGVISAFEKMVDERLGTLQVDVTSAQDLNPQQQAALVRQLEAMTGKKVRLNLQVDGDLVGGVVVRLGSTVYDGSVRAQLEALGRQLRAE